MGVIFVPLYIRAMGIESYGLVGVYASLVSIFSVLDLGLGAAMNREMARLSVQSEPAARARNLARTLEMIYWATALAIGIAVVFLAGPIADHWVNPDTLPRSVVKQVIVIIGVVIALRWPVGLYSGGLMGMQKQAILNIVLSCSATFRAVGALLTLWLVSPTIQAFFLFQVLSAICETLAVAIMLWASMPTAPESPRFDFEAIREVWRFSAGMTGISLAVLLLTQTDKVILSRMLSLEQFGYYTLAWTVAAVLIRFVVPINLAVYPRFTQFVALKDSDGLKELYHRASQFASVALVPISMILIFFPDSALYAWSGDTSIVEQAGPALRILSVGALLNGLMNLPNYMQLAHGWTSLFLGMNVGSVVALIPLMILLTTLHGMVGAATGWVLINLGYILIGLHLMHRRILEGEKWGWYIRDVGMPVLVALALSGVGRLLLPDDLSRFLLIFYMGVVYCICLIAAVFVTPLARTSLLENAKITFGKVFPRAS